MASAGVDDWVDPSKMSSKQKAAAAGADDWVDPSKGGKTDTGGEQLGSDTGYGAAISSGIVSGVPFGQRLAALASTYLPTSLSGDPGAANTYEENYRRIGNQIATSWNAHPWVTGGSAIVPAMIPGGGVGRAALYGGALGLGQTDDLSDIGGDIKSAGLGAAGGAAGAKVAEGLGAALAPSSSAERAALLGAGQQVGADIPRYMSSSNPLVQRAGELIKSSPIGSGPVEQATGKLYKQLGAKAGELAQGPAGGAATKETAGASVKSALEDAIGPVSDAEANRLFSAPRNTIAAAGGTNTKTPLSNLRSVVDQIDARRADILPDSKATSYVQKALDAPGGLTYQQIKDLRSNIGAMNHWGVLPEGMDGGEVSQVYGALSKDLEQSALNSGGQQALNEHLAANTGYQALADTRKQLATLIGGRDALRSPEGVYNAMKTIAGDQGGANIGLLRTVKQSVPASSWDELGRGMIANMGQDGQGNWTPLRFLTDYGKISSAAKDELFGASGASSLTRQNLDALQTISQRIKEHGAKYANVSKTGHTVGAVAGAEALSHAVLHGHPLAAIAGIIGAPMMGKFLATPAGSGAATSWTRAAYSGSQTAMRYAAQRLNATLRNQGINVPWSQIAARAQPGRAAGVAAGAQLGSRIDPSTGLAGLMSWEHGEEGGGGGDQAMQTP